MGVFSRLTSVFSGKGGGRFRGGVAGLAPEEPVIVKWPPEPATHEAVNPAADSAQDAGETASLEVAHASEVAPTLALREAAQQELASELREELKRNYAEVVELIRKVSTHLDRQGERLDASERRQERFMELVEAIPEALATLPQIREQNVRLLEMSERLAGAMTALAETTREGQAGVQQALVEQARASRESAERIEALIERSSAAQDRAASSLGELAAVIGSSSERLTGMLAEMQDRAVERERRITESVVRGQKWIAAAIGLAVLAVGVAGVIGVLALR